MDSSRPIPDAGAFFYTTQRPMRLVHSRYAKISYVCLGKRVEFLEPPRHIGIIESDKVDRGRVATPQHPRFTSVLLTVRVKSPDRRTKRVFDKVSGFCNGRDKVNDYMGRCCP